MPSASATISPAFRKQMTKAALTIVLFIIVYLLLFALSIGLTIFCGWCALMVLGMSVNYLTIGLGAGLFAMGLFVTYFMLKFIFSKHKVDRSHLTEITREEEPQLFAMIEEIVKEVETDFPKKVYLSSDINAFVFYDSSFWSMFFPVRKNLEIGLGLVNSVTRLELKSILAHEFGHFSQRSMKLGSYVYNVNRVIYNMLYDNGSYGENVSSVANVSTFIAMFTHVAMAIVGGIQAILKKLYNLINVTYMGLSREMEFHADEVSAYVAGSGPGISCELRFDLSRQAWSNVIDFYNRRYQQSVTSVNLFTQHRWMMERQAKAQGVKLEGGLPWLTESQYERFNRSKLVIKNQWASHPSSEERVAAFHRLNIQRETENFEPANNIFTDIQKRQEAFTDKLFAPVTFPSEIVKEDLRAFTEAFDKEYPEYILPEIFNGYYNNWSPAVYTAEKPARDLPARRPEYLFSDEIVNLTYSLTSFEKDKALLHQLTVVDHRIKTFDYDGVKYSMDNIYTLMEKLDESIGHAKDELNANDAAVHAYFRGLARKAGREAEWEERYGTYAEVEDGIEKRYDPSVAFLESINFMSETTPNTEIEQRLPGVMEKEGKYKAILGAVLEEKAYKAVILPEEKELLAKYVSFDKVYFADGKYDNDAVQLLYDAIDTYNRVTGRARNTARAALLDYSARLVKEESAVAV